MTERRHRRRSDQMKTVPVRNIESTDIPLAKLEATILAHLQYLQVTDPSKLPDFPHTTTVALISGVVEKHLRKKRMMRVQSIRLEEISELQTDVIPKLGKRVLHPILNEALERWRK